MKYHALLVVAVIAFTSPVSHTLETGAAEERNESRQQPEKSSHQGVGRNETRIDTSRLPKKCPVAIELYVDGELRWTKTSTQLLEEPETVRLKEARRGLPLAAFLSMSADAKSIAVYSCWPKEREVFGLEKFLKDQPEFVLVPNKKGAVKLERLRGDSNATVFRGVRRIEVSGLLPGEVIDEWRREFAAPHREERNGEPAEG